MKYGPHVDAAFLAIGPRQRELWCELNEVRALEGLKMEWSNRLRLEGVLANLLRMWSR